MLNNTGHLISELVACFNQSLQWPPRVTLDEHFNVFVLQIRHQSILGQLLFLDVEGVDDHTDKKVEDEQTTNNHEEGEEDN